MFPGVNYTIIRELHYKHPNGKVYIDDRNIKFTFKVSKDFRKHYFLQKKINNHIRNDLSVAIFLYRRWRIKFTTDISIGIIKQIHPLFNTETWENYNKKVTLLHIVLSQNAACYLINSKQYKLDSPFNINAKRPWGKYPSRYLIKHPYYESCAKAYNTIMLELQKIAKMSPRTKWRYINKQRLPEFTKFKKHRKSYDKLWTGVDPVGRVLNPRENKRKQWMKNHKLNSLPEHKNSISDDRDCSVCCVKHIVNNMVDCKKCKKYFICRQCAMQARRLHCPMCKSPCGVKPRGRSEQRNWAHNIILNANPTDLNAIRAAIERTISERTAADEALIADAQEILAEDAAHDAAENVRLNGMFARVDEEIDIDAELAAARAEDRNADAELAAARAALAELAAARAALAAARAEFAELSAAEFADANAAEDAAVQSRVDWTIPFHARNEDVD
jgi:hypothetical protein